MALARRIPLGTLILFSGDPKLGKGLTTHSLAAAVTRGGPLPGPGAGGDGAGPTMAPRGSAVLLSAEDDPASVIVPRLLAANAVMERVKIIPSIERGASDTNGKDRVLGDIAWVGAWGSNFLFLRDPDDPTGRRRLMLDNGRNLGPGQAGLPFVIRDDDAGPYCDGLPETVDLDADAALARAVNAARSGPSGGRLARRSECHEWLRGYLAEGPRPATDCERAAEVAGFSRSILIRARTDLAVRCVCSGFDQGSCSSWSLPEAAAKPPVGP